MTLLESAEGRRMTVEIILGHRDGQCKSCYKGTILQMNSLENDLFSYNFSIDMNKNQSFQYIGI